MDASAIAGICRHFCGARFCITVLPFTTNAFTGFIRFRGGTFLIRATVFPFAANAFTGFIRFRGGTFLILIGAARGFTVAITTSQVQ
jgi:hypothetical protein